MKKSLIAIFSTVCLTGAMLVTAIAAPENVSAAYATKALENAVNNGLLVGDNGNLNPQGNLTRAEMAAVINRAFNAKEVTPITKFTDVQNGAWYYNDMAKAVRMGTFLGEGTTLAPERNISREEAFTVVARAFKLQNGGNLNSTSYVDADQVSNWAKNQVYAMINDGYVTGDGTHIDPKSYITRQDFAVIFDRMVNQYIKTPGTVTSVTGKNVMVNVGGVTLKDLTIEGNLIIGDGVGAGTVVLDNVTVKGRVFVRGGGTLNVKGKSLLTLIEFAIPSGNNEILFDVEDGSAVARIIILENEPAVKFKGVNIDDVETYTGPFGMLNTGTSVTTAVYGTGSGVVTGGTNNNVTPTNTAITRAYIDSTSGTPVVGSVLTASVSPSAATASYQWYVGGVAVSNGTTYVVKVGDIGKTIYATATGTGSYTGSATTEVTATVGVSSVIATINGVDVPVVGNTVTRPANNDTLNYVTIDFGVPVTIQDAAAYVTVKEAGSQATLQTGRIEKISDSQIRIYMENALTQKAWRKGTFEISLIAGVVQDTTGSSNAAYTFTLVLN